MDRTSLEAKLEQKKAEVKSLSDAYQKGEEERNNLITKIVAANGALAMLQELVDTDKQNTKN